MKKNIYFFMLICFIRMSSIHAQTRTIDSLTDLLQNTKQDTMRCLLLEQLGYQYQGSNPDRALIFTQQGLDLSRKIKYLEGEVKCLTRMGSIYSITGNGTRGLELVLQALKASEKLNDPAIRSTILRLAGDVYSDLGDSRKSMEYDFKSLEIASSMHYEMQRAVCLIDIGDNYEKLNILDSAKIYTEAGYEIAHKQGNLDFTGVALNNLGNIYSKRQEPVLAMNYYRKSIPYQELVRDDEGICETQLGLATQFRQLGMFDSCVYYAGLAYTSAKNNGFTVYLLKIGNFLADYYKQYHQVDSAYKYLVAVVAAKDSMFSQEKVKQVQRLSFDETLRQQELALQKKKAEEDHIRNLQLLGIGIFIPVFFLIVLFLSRTKVSPRVVEFLGILSLLLLFEFITDLIYPYVGNLTNENPIWEMLILVVIAAILEPLNNRLEHFVKKHLVHKSVPVPVPVVVSVPAADDQSFSPVE